VITLDEYVETASLGRLDMVKADIEGVELPFLKGAVKTLKRFKPDLMLEVQAHSTRLFGYEPKTLFELLGNLGYDAFYLGQDSVLKPFLIKPNKNEGLPDYNFIFKHKDNQA